MSSAPRCRRVFCLRSRQSLTSAPTNCRRQSSFGTSCSKPSWSTRTVTAQTSLAFIFWWVLKLLRVFLKRKWPNSHNTPSITLASCLINAQHLPAHTHRPAADDNGCTGHDLTDDWSLPSAHFVDSWCPFRCSFWCVLLLNQMFWKPCAVRQYHSDLSDQSVLEIRVRI